MAIANKTSILCYGRSGVGKSTQARYIAEYIHRTTGKKTRLIALDRGSLWAPCQDLVDEGIVIPLEFPTASEFNPMATMRKLRRGEWPENGVINRPTAVESKGPRGVEIKYKTNTKWIPWSEQDTAEIGAIVVDSLTSYALTLMSDSKQKNIRIGQDATNQPRTEDGETAGTNTQSHYGDAHTEVLDAMNAFQALPVEIVMFTALEGLGTDDDGPMKRPALGPQTVGKAINAVVPTRVQNSFHFTTEGEGAKRQIRAWYSDHPSELPKMLWPAKVGLLVTEIREFQRKYPNGYIPITLEKGIGEFLEFRDSMRTPRK